MFSRVSNFRTDKLKSIIKVIGYWALFLILLILLISQSGNIFSTHVHRFVSGFFGSALALFVTWIFLRSERKSFADYNLIWTTGTLFRFIAGVLIGVASIALITLILVLFAGLDIQKNPQPGDPWIWLWYLAILPAAFMEEIAFRSYPLLKLKRTIGLWPAQLLISIAFTLYHISIGWSILTAFLGPGVWAFIFGIAAIRSRGIALPTGIHVGLNAMLSIFGMSQGVESFFISSQNNNVANTIVNLLTRILVLLTGIFLTEFFIRKSKNKNGSKVMPLAITDPAD